MLLGVFRDGRPEAGVIRMPALNEVFGGFRGGHATCNGQRIRCRPAPRLAEARLYLNEANQLMEREPDRFSRLMRAGKLRRFAYDCYSFALLAMGQIDAVVDFDLQPYDYMAVVPVVEAAGGRITDWQGRPLGLGSDGSVLAAGSVELHGACSACSADAKTDLPARLGQWHECHESLRRLTQNLSCHKIAFVDPSRSPGITKISIPEVLC
jgi:fructose-1,6-bisphosphatase/inositol monophosphatase family enzyme